MKKLTLLAAAALSALFLLDGCVASVGSGPKMENRNPTLGQQLIDLKTARDSGAITPAEYEAQKARMLGEKTN